MGASICLPRYQDTTDGADRSQAVERHGALPEVDQIEAVPVGLLILLATDDVYYNRLQFVAMN